MVCVIIIRGSHQPRGYSGVSDGLDVVYLLCILSWPRISYFLTTLLFLSPLLTHYSWSVFGSIWAVFECLPGGISSAAIVRISFHLGNANPRMAKIVAYKSLLYVAILALGVTLIFLSHSEAIILLFTHNRRLSAMLEDSVSLLAMGNVLMCVGSCAWSIVNAQSRTRLATLIYVLIVWGVTTPLSPVYIFALGYGIDSLASTIVVGYATLALVLLVVVFTTNWTKESMRIIIKSGTTVSLAGVEILS